MLHQMRNVVDGFQSPPQQINALSRTVAGGTYVVGITCQKEKRNERLNCSYSRVDVEMCRRVLVRNKRMATIPY